MVKRPMVIITICYIIGILGGIYLKKYISLFCCILIVINWCGYKYFINTKWLKSMSRVKDFKYKRRFFYICILIIFLSGICIYYKNEKFYNFNVENNTICAIAIVVDVKPESQYYYNYIVKVVKLNNKKCNKKMFLMIKKNKENKKFEYADLLKIKGTFEKGEVRRNYMGYSQFEYLKHQNVYGIIKGENSTIIKNKSTNTYKLWINRVKTHIRKCLVELISEENIGIANALLLGDGSLISEEQKHMFSSANLSHILAISGMHVSYIIIGIRFLLKKISKRKSKYILVILLVLFAFIAGGAPSVVRAVIMSTLAIIASLVYRKSDTLNNIAISAFLILLYNPYNLFNLGFQLSFLGTLGIVLFNARINFKVNKFIQLEVKYIENKKIKFFKNDVLFRLIKRKFFSKIVDLISVSISANILIFPILIYNFNKISFIFLISNLLVTPVLAVLVFSGYIVAICSFVSNKIAFISGKFFDFFISCFRKIAEFSSFIDLTKLVIGTPKISTIFFIYLLIFVWYYYSFLYSKFLCFIKKHQFIKFIKNKFQIIKENQIKNLFNVVLSFSAIIAILFPYFNLHKSTFTIHFIDVGQGDSSLIITSSNKKVLIDGGGSETGNYDVGEKVLVPYLLDRQIRSIDFLIFSHFDSDHCQGLFTVMKELKVKNAVISEQSKDSSNYKYFCQLAKEKKVKVIKVKAGNRLKIDNSTYIQFLWPIDNQIAQNALNNNSILCKVFFNNISILFTGDVEAVAESEIEKIYGKGLQADILKVAHHGSITSSTEKFLEYVKPKIALIGVGKNNKFNHPSDEVVSRLKNMRNNNL